MIVSLVVAASENNVIGVKGKLPWHLPDDLKFFKDVTTGHPVIMGRKTFESMGKALPHRLNIVISRTPSYYAKGTEVVHSLTEALEEARVHLPPEKRESEVFVIGGGEVFLQAMGKANRIYMTRVHTTIEGGDAFFPGIDPKVWKEVSKKEHPKDEKHEYGFTFLVYEKGN